MIRICFDNTPPYHGVDDAHPGGLIRLDCGLERAYQRVHLTTGDVNPDLRCAGCEQKRLAAVEYFVEGAVAGMEAE